MKSGNGSSTLFWTTKWIGEIPLALAYPRLFSLPNEKDGKVGDLLVIDGGLGHCLGVGGFSNGRRRVWLI
jgi:hypothetical protein